jgi:amino acid transporter
MKTPWRREKTQDVELSPSSSIPVKSDEREGYGLDPAAPPPDHTELHRGLKARHITMIAIGGAIGTGLIIGTGKALATAG